MWCTLKSCSWVRMFSALSLSKRQEYQKQRCRTLWILSLPGLETSLNILVFVSVWYIQISRANQYVLLFSGSFSGPGYIFQKKKSECLKSQSLSLMESFWSSKFLNTPGFVLSQIFRDSNLESEFGCDLLKKQLRPRLCSAPLWLFLWTWIYLPRTTRPQNNGLTSNGVSLAFKYL